MLPAAPAPTLDFAFTIRAELSPPVEQGEIDLGRRRFIPVVAGAVSGPLLQAEILPGGGDWQTMLPGGLTLVEARYLLRAADGTVIEVTNPGLRVASEEVTADLARGVPVAPDAYYFRTTPRFAVAPGAHEWMRRAIFVARGLRRPDSVEIDVWAVR